MEDPSLIAGTRRRRRLVEGAIPSIFGFSACPVVTDPLRAERARRRDVPAPSTSHSDPPPALGVQLVEDTPEVPDVMMEVEVEEVEEPASRGSPPGRSDMLPLCHFQDQHIQVDSSFQGRGLRIDKVLTDPAMIRYFTTFVDYAHFKYFFQILGPATTSLAYQCQSLEPEEELLLTLMKLRLNKDDMELGFFFGISEKVASKVFHTWLNFMYYQLKELNLWLPRDVVDQYMPEDFKMKFPGTRVIIDGTEIGIEQPGSTKAQAAMWSSYKNKNTLKVLVGISPKGAVTYISSVYGGSVSDRQIVERSDLATAQGLFCEGDGIMCDKGFTIKDLFCNKGVSVNTPTFLKGMTQLSAEKVASDQKISSKRVHVERIIGAAKTFRILAERLKNKYVPLGGRILFVCLVIQNFKPSIVH